MSVNQTSERSAELAPRIMLSAEDHERLSRLARAAMNSVPERAEDLAAELERAHVLARSRLGEVVCMGSHVAFRDDTTGRVRQVTLVYPEQADISKGTVSVLTPIGTALLGLRKGLSIGWQTRSGENRRLTVLEILQPGDAEAGFAESTTHPE
jgi:regulator of nucleoside diphosphate kinase